MLTYSGFHFRFLSFPCGFLFLPSSVNSLDFMSYANQSSESELIHHLGSSGWMKLDGFQSPPCSPQPPATRRMRVASGARPGVRRDQLTKQKGQRDAHFSPSSWKGESAFHATFPQGTTILLKSNLKMGSWGASESRLSVNKLSGTGLIHHGYWVAAKDPTVIRLSFFPSK